MGSARPVLFDVVRPAPCPHHRGSGVGTVVRRGEPGGYLVCGGQPHLDRLGARARRHRPPARGVPMTPRPAYPRAPRRVDMSSDAWSRGPDRFVRTCSNRAVSNGRLSISCATRLTASTTAMAARRPPTSPGRSSSTSSTCEMHPTCCPCPTSGSSGSSSPAPTAARARWRSPAQPSPRGSGANAQTRLLSGAPAPEPVAHLDDHGVGDRRAVHDADRRPG
jgi:hypothetical protein